MGLNFISFHKPSLITQKPECSISLCTKNPYCTLVYFPLDSLILFTYCLGNFSSQHLFILIGHQYIYTYKIKTLKHFIYLTLEYLLGVTITYMYFLVCIITPWYYTCAGITCVYHESNMIISHV